MKQILILITMGLVMLMAAGCVSSPVVNTPLPTSVPTTVPTIVATPYTASPIVSYIPTPVQTNNTAFYNITGSVLMGDGTVLNGYTVAVACNGVNNVSDQYSGLTDANGLFKISFSAPRGHYDNFSVTVISPSKQLVYQDKEPRQLAGDETADINL
jgi:hypothetical protein